MRKSLIRSRTGAVAIAAAVLFVGAGGFAVAGSNSITGCVAKDGTLRVTSDACRKNESPIAWDQVGPAGPMGATGATGATGPAGSNALNSFALDVPPTFKVEVNDCTAASSASNVSQTVSVPAGTYLLQDATNRYAKANGGNDTSGVVQLILRDAANNELTRNGFKVQGNDGVNELGFNIFSVNGTTDVHLFAKTSVFGCAFASVEGPVTLVRIS